MLYEHEKYILEKELDSLTEHYNDDPQKTLMLLIKLLGYMYYDVRPLDISGFVDMIFVGFKNQLSEKENIIFDVLMAQICLYPDEDEFLFSPWICRLPTMDHEVERIGRIYNDGIVKLDKRHFLFTFECETGKEDLVCPWFDILRMEKAEKRKHIVRFKPSKLFKYMVLCSTLGHSFATMSKTVDRL